MFSSYSSGRDIKEASFVGRYLLPWDLMLLKISFIFNFLYICEWYVPMCQVGGQKVPDPLALQIEAFVSHLVLVLGPQPQPSSFEPWMSLDTHAK